MNHQFSILKSQPTDAELGAIITVLMAATRASAPIRETTDRPVAGGWKSYWRTVRLPLNPGREAWRSAYR